jgi:gamma-butyrobetaine dioxygenase
VPTVQLLHCLSTADDGGDTSLVDGFAAAAALRAGDAEAFDVLTGTAVPFGYIDKETELRASQPLIQLSPRGRIRGVRFNNRSTRPLRLPYAEVAAFYPAYRRWAQLLAQPDTRVLHARTAFSMTPGSPGSSGSSGRHLQGCYADLDGLASTLAVLRRPGNQELKEES